MNAKIVDYRIVEGNLSFVTDLVFELLKEGWQPFGSLAYSGEQEFEDSDDGVTESCYAQPMVKYEQPQTLNAPGDRP